ncbi:MAG: hypothetical protein ACTHKB_03180 [Burkholderiaceae bacterium]
MLPAPLLPAVPVPEDVLSPVPEPLVPEEPPGGVVVAPDVADPLCPAPPLVMPLVPGAVAPDEPLEAAPPGLDVLLLVPVLVSAPVVPLLVPAAGAPVEPVPELLVVPAPEDVEPPLSPDLLQPPAASANTAMTGRARTSLVSCVMVFPFSIGFACRRPGENCSTADARGHDEAGSVPTAARDRSTATQCGAPQICLLPMQLRKSYRI